MIPRHFWQHRQNSCLWCQVWIPVFEIWFLQITGVCVKVRCYCQVEFVLESCPKKVLWKDLSRCKVGFCAAKSGSPGHWSLISDSESGSQVDKQFNRWSSFIFRMQWRFVKTMTRQQDCKPAQLQKLELWDFMILKGTNFFQWNSLDTDLAQNWSGHLNGWPSEVVLFCCFQVKRLCL